MQVREFLNRKVKKVQYRRREDESSSNKTLSTKLWQIITSSCSCPATRAKKIRKFEFTSPKTMTWAQELVQKLLACFSLKEDDRMLVYPAALSVLEQLVLLIYIFFIRSKEGSITKCL
jgi:hypothetical protein